MRARDVKQAELFRIEESDQVWFVAVKRSRRVNGIEEPDITIAWANLPFATRRVLKGAQLDVEVELLHLDDVPEAAVIVRTRWENEVGSLRQISE